MSTKVEDATAVLNSVEQILTPEFAEKLSRILKAE